jgi:hypothetical protein
MSTAEPADQAITGVDTPRPNARPLFWGTTHRPAPIGACPLRGAKVTCGLSDGDAPCPLRLAGREERPPFHSGRPELDDRRKDARVKAGLLNRAESAGRLKHLQDRRDPRRRCQPVSPRRDPARSACGTANRSGMTAHTRSPASPPPWTRRRVGDGARRPAPRPGRAEGNRCQPLPPGPCPWWPCSSPGPVITSG